jgi:hypothetical protein
MQLYVRSSVLVALLGSLSISFYALSYTTFGYAPSHITQRDAPAYSLQQLTQAYLDNADILTLQQLSKLEEAAFTLEEWHTYQKQLAQTNISKSLSRPLFYATGASTGIGVLSALSAAYFLKTHAICSTHFAAPAAIALACIPISIELLFEAIKEQRLLNKERTKLKDETRALEQLARLLEIFKQKRLELHQKAR